MQSTEDMILEEIRIAREERAQHRARPPSPRFVTAVHRAPRDLRGGAPRAAVFTRPEPFDLLSERRHESAAREMQLQADREREELEQRRAFRARPVPDPTQSANAQSLPPVLSKPPTSGVAPSCVERAHVAQEFLQEKRAEEERQQARQREFHARPVPSTTYEVGFMPKVPHAQVYSGYVELRSSARAEERRQFDDLERVRRSEAERRQHEFMELQREQMDLETRELRKSQVHRPLPVPASSMSAGTVARAPPAAYAQAAQMLSRGLGSAAAATVRSDACMGVQRHSKAHNYTLLSINRYRRIARHARRGASRSEQALVAHHLPFCLGVLFLHLQVVLEQCLRLGA